MPVLAISIVVAVIVACAVIVHKGLKITGLDANGVLSFLVLAIVAIVGIVVAADGLLRGNLLPIVLLILVIGAVVGYLRKLGDDVNREHAARAADPWDRATHRRLLAEGSKCLETPCPFCAPIEE
jgi:hypothetical protein